MKFDFSPYGKNVKKDPVPDWMNNIVNDEGKYNRNKPDFSKLFEDKKKSVRNCSCCGKILKPNEIGKCSSCLNVKRES